MIASVLEHGVEPWSLALLASIDPETLLDPIDRVRHLQAFDRSRHYVAAGQQRALVAVAGLRPSGDLRASGTWSTRSRSPGAPRAVAPVVTSSSRGRCARSSKTPRSRWSAARSPSSTPPPWSSAPGTSRRREARAEVEARVLPQPRPCSPAMFRRRVDAAVCAVDAADEARRHARASGDRQVWVRRIENGLGELVRHRRVVRDVAMYERITDDATRPAARTPRRRRGEAAAARRRRGGSTREPLDDGWVDRTLDNCRADALSDLVLRDDATTTDPDAMPDRTPRPDGTAGPRRPRRRRAPRIEGRLVIDLATLRGEADNPCLLDGSPIPAPIGRRLARDIATGGAWSPTRSTGTSSTTAGAPTCPIGCAPSSASATAAQQYVVKRSAATGPLLLIIGNRPVMAAAMELGCRTDKA